MSDFKNIKDFKKGKLSRYPYQDPTYLSFVLMFNFNDKYNSPLLSGETELYLKQFIDDGSSKSPVDEKDKPLDGQEAQPKEISANQNEVNENYSRRLEALQNFIKALKTINNEMPWYWQGLTGVDRLLKPDPLNSSWAGEEATLSIKTLESINLAISGLMELYRTAVFDEQQWKYIIPWNLRKFSMSVYVTEIRTIKNMSAPKVNGSNNNDASNILKPAIQLENSNAELSGVTARPYFMFDLGYCEFDLTSGSTPFADLSKSPEEAASNDIIIHYDKLNKVESRVLNGIIETSFDTDKLSPAPDGETESIDNLKDWKVSNESNQRLSDINGGVIDTMRNYSKQKMLELQMTARNATVNRIPNFENVFQNFVRGVDNSLNNTLQGNTETVNSLVGQNVYGIQPGDTIGDA